MEYEDDFADAPDYDDRDARCCSCGELDYMDNMYADGSVECEICNGTMHEHCSVESPRGYRICTGIECLAADRHECELDEAEANTDHGTVRDYDACVGLAGPR